MEVEAPTNQGVPWVQVDDGEMLTTFIKAHNIAHKVAELLKIIPQFTPQFPEKRPAKLFRCELGRILSISYMIDAWTNCNTCVNITRTA